MGFCQPEETERFLGLVPAWEKAMTDSGILPLARRDLTLPKRQPPGGYVPPELPLRHIPTPF